MPGLLEDIVKLRYNYHRDNQQTIIMDFKNYLIEKKLLENYSQKVSEKLTHNYENSINTINIENYKHQSSSLSNIKKSESLPELIIDINKIKANQRKKIDLELKRQRIRKHHEKFKNLHEQRLKEIETERKLQHDKIIDKLNRNSSTINIRKNSIEDKYAEKIEKIKK